MKVAYSRHTAYASASDAVVRACFNLENSYLFALTWAHYDQLVFWIKNLYIYNGISGLIPHELTTVCRGQLHEIRTVLPHQLTGTTTEYGQR